MKNGTYKAKSQGFHPAVTVTTTIENIDKLRKGDCMRLRQAEMKDFDRIIEILKDGKNQLAERGVDQWQGDYPSLDQIREDIEKGQAFLAVQQDNQTVGAISIVKAPDHSYDQMTGKWLIQTNDYVVIHRLAIHSDHAGHGYATKLFQEVIRQIYENHPQIKSIRIDTHEDNKAMQHLIDKMDFTRVGTLHGVYCKGQISYVYEMITNSTKKN